MQIMGFVYMCMMHFPNVDFSIKTFTSARFLEYLYHIMTLKVSLHYSHIAGKIHGGG